jgi:uncharacterized membrane protein YgaE (UPF0421/DUF939 family)
MMLVRFLAMGEKLDHFNSNKIDSRCEEFKRLLLDEDKSIELFSIAANIFNGSSIDKERRQYKAESDTEILIEAYRAHNKLMQPTAEASAD